MHLIPDFSLADLIPPDALAQYTGRDDTGIHVSEICSALAQAISRGEDYAPASDTGRALHFLKGLAFEDVLGRAFADRTCRLYRPNGFRPGQITIPTPNGTPVIGTPDWCDIDVLNVDTGAEGQLRVEDSKATSLSSRLEIDGPKAIYWRFQLKTYAAMVGALEGRLLVLHLLGDYLYAKSPEPGPHFRVYQEFYTETELAEYWQTVVCPQADRMWAARQAKKGSR